MLDLIYSYQFDKYINKYFVEKFVWIFKNINPNTITIFGMIINGFMIHYYFILNIKNMTAFLLMIRILCDNLDGMVARKFNKVSKFGGLLDSISDCILLTTIWYGVFTYFNIYFSFCTALLFGCAMLWYLIIQDALFMHSNFTLDKNNLNKLPIFISENTYGFSLLIILLMYYVNPT